MDEKKLQQGNRNTGTRQPNGAPRKPVAKASGQGPARPKAKAPAKKKTFSFKRAVKNYQAMKQKEAEERRITKPQSIPRTATTQYDMVDSSTGRYATASSHEEVLRKKKKKYHFNMKRLIPFILACILVLVGIGFAIYGISHIGKAKEGYYNFFVQAETENSQIGLVTELKGDGTPAKIQRLSTTEDGRYIVPVQYGGKALLIVADDSYSFTRIGDFNFNYYLCTVDVPTSSHPRKEARYERRHHIKELSSKETAISTKANVILGGIRLYGKEKDKDALASATIGTEQPVLNAKDLTYIGKTLTGEEEEKGEAKTVSFTFTASGDNLIHQRLYEQAATRSTNGGYDFSFCYKNVADFYKKHDVNWFNQESLANNKIPAHSYPTFSTPGQAVQALYDMNVRVFSIANNHTYDQGANGLAATEEFYQNDMPKDICYSGLWDKQDFSYIPTYTYKGIKIAFLSYTYGTNGIPVPSTSQKRCVLTTETDIIKEQVTKANKEADLVIVGCHWGTENSHNIISEQTTLAQNLADWGADLIIGTHPHVVQNAGWIRSADGRDVFCAYSLGNFLSTQSTPDQVVGAVLECKFTVTKNGNGTADVSLENPALIPTVTVYGANASNCHTVFLSQYSANEALNHGCRNQYSYFNYNWIVDMLSKNISSDFLVLPEGVSPTVNTDPVTVTRVQTTAAATQATQPSSQVTQAATQPATPAPQAGATQGSQSATQSASAANWAAAA